MSKIETVGKLRKILNGLDDDYKLDIRIMKAIPEKELCLGVYENKGEEL